MSKAARKDLTDAHTGIADALDTAVVKAGQPGNDGKALIDPAAGLALNAAQLELTAAKSTSRKTASHLPHGQVRPSSRLLEAERKLLTHAIRMSANNTESALAQLLRPHYARGDDQGRVLLREACTPVTSRSSPALCTSGSTPPAPPHAARPSRPLQRTQRHQNALLRHHTHAPRQRQRPSQPCAKDLTMSGGLDSSGPSGRQSGASTAQAGALWAAPAASLQDRSRPMPVRWASYVTVRSPVQPAPS